jgi:hypothetical protein
MNNEQGVKMNKFSKLRIGSPVADVEGHWSENFTVVAVGYNWAVLRGEDGEIHEYVLLPTDGYEIGRFEYDENDDFVLMLEDGE